MKFANSQRGMSSAGWMMALVVAGMAILVAVKILPIYIDDNAIGSIVASLDGKTSIEKASPRLVRSYISKGIQTNMVYNFDKKNDIAVYEEDGFLKVYIEYEKRIHLISNVDLVMSFEHYWQIRNR